MTQRLTEIDVDEISLVSKPANRRKFTLLKQEEELMTDTDKLLAEIQKLGPDERAKFIEKLAPESEEAWRERVLKAIEADDTEVLKDDRAMEVVAAEVKSLQEGIAELRKHNQEADERLAKEKAAAVRKSYIEKATDYKNIPGVTADDFGPILMKCEAALDEDEVKKLNEILKAACENMRTDLTKESGSGVDTGAEDIVARIDALVKAEMEADSKLSSAQARARVYKKEPALLQAELDAEPMARDNSGAGE
jgi:hypothetical protein